MSILAFFKSKRFLSLRKTETLKKEMNCPNMEFTQNI